MQIICPNCQFTRSIPDEKIPATAEMATCPKCGHKFKFRSLASPVFGDSTEMRPAPGQHAPSASSPAPFPVPSDTATTPPHSPPPSRTQASVPQGDIWDRIASLGKDEPGRETTPGAATRPDNARKPAPADAMRIPWENLETFGFFPGLALTTKHILLSPTRFFQSMPVDGNIARPLSFYVLIGMFSSFIQYIWSSVANIILASMGMTEGMEGNPLYVISGLAGAGSIFLLVVSPLLFTMAIFISTAANHLFLALFQAASAGFNGTFRAAAYGYAPYIIGVIPVVGPAVAMIWCLMTTIIAYKTVHQTTYPRVICAIFFPFAVFALGALILSGTMPFMFRA